MTPLDRILAQAAKAVNAGHSIKLRKVFSLGDDKRGAGVYHDKDWGEYRILFVLDGEYLREADGHCDDVKDAWDTAQHHVKQA